jgi:hypothetical protein
MGMRGEMMWIISKSEFGQPRPSMKEFDGILDEGCVNGEVAGSFLFIDDFQMSALEAEHS